MTIRAHRWPLAVSCVLCVAWLGSRPLDLDEAIVLTRSSLGVGDLILTPYSPLYLVLLNLWSRVADDPLWLRLLGVVLGFAGLFLCPRVLRGLGGTHAEGGAVWLLACSPFFVDQLRTVSPAQLALLMVLLSYLCFFEYVRAGQRRWLAGWMVSALLAVLVHGGLYCVVIVQCLAMAFYRHRLSTRQRSWWLAQIAPLILFGALFGTQFNRFIAHRLSQVNQVSAVSDQWSRLATVLPLPWSAVGGIVVLLLILSGLRSYRDWRRDTRHGLLILGLAVPSAIWLLWLPHDFYALAALPCLATIGSMGIRSYPRWGRQLLCVAVIVIYGWSHWHSLPY